MITTQATSLSATYNVIDVDTHIIEPPDLWTTRMSKKWGDLVPHVKKDAKTGATRWHMGDLKLPTVGAMAHAGWKEYPPSHPPTLEEADPASWKADMRLKRMDEYGIQSAVLYPNLLGFYCETFMKTPDRALGIECVRAYNDFLAEWCATAPDRLVPVAFLPFWDIDATVAEARRVARIGHRGVIMSSDFAAIGLPELYDPYWDPLYAVLQELGLCVNFHAAFADKTMDEARKVQRLVVANKAAYVKGSTMMFMNNAKSMCDIILFGVCQRFPKINFVSVESGASWLPFLMEMVDWQWQNSGAARANPGWLLPSDYFRRQWYGSFWFERALLKEAIRNYPDNFMFETDYPHPTSLSPGPASISKNPRVVIEENLAGLPADIVQKVLHDNAARVYGLTSSASRKAA